MSNFEKLIISLISLLIIAVLVFGAIVFRQQKTINALKGSTAGTSKQSAIQPAVQSPVEKDNLSLTEAIKQFSGTIENISGNQLTISVKMADLSKPKNPEEMKNASGPVNLSSDDFETLEKKITVNINEKTVFVNKKLADFKVGDTVSVTSDKSPYSADTVTAEKIASGLPK